MARRKLSQQQRHRIDDFVPDPTWQLGQVVARFNKSVEIASATLASCISAPIPAKFQGAAQADDIVVGDWIYFDLDTEQIQARASRKTQLSRWRRNHSSTKTASRAFEKVVAANITQMCIVIAPVPEATRLVIDEYLLAADMQGFKAILISNKSDLIAKSNTEYQQVLADYAQLGVATIATSATEPAPDLAVKSALCQALDNHTSIFIGTSGVGKSSLLNQLTGEATAAVGEISAQAELGKHTTTTARLYTLASEMKIIDAPGIREFRLNQASIQELCHGYSDLYANGQCRYNNCTHREEPGCCVKEALANGNALSWRYENYLELYARLVDEY